MKPREGGKGSSLFPLLQQAVDKAAAHPLHRHQTETDVLPRHGEVGAGFVDIRRHELDAVVPALGDVLRHLGLGIQHRGQQSRHILPGVVDLEPGGLVDDNGIADRVCLVEGVVGEVVDLVVDVLGSLLRNAVGDTSGNVSFGVAVNESPPLLLDLGPLLLGHGTPDHVGLPQGKTRQLPENLDDLLLIDDAPIRHGEDWLQQRVLVADQAGVVLAGDEPGDGIHGTRAIQGDDGRDVLDVLGLQSHAHPRHTR